MATYLTVPLGLVALVVAWFVYRNRQVLLRVWREPVFRHPILIIESDDWGPGEEADAGQLARIAGLLARYKNRRGRSPLVTLGLILAVPNTHSMASDMTQYRRLLLTDRQFSGILTAIREGLDKGVFSLQLHGMEHYWPPALLDSARTDGRARAWLSQGNVPRAEDLPSELQSRWTNAATLPSRPLSVEEIQEAVHEEVATFAMIFGHRPLVAVPPTFVWNATVERAWASEGIQVIVTPGLRYEERDVAGALVPAGSRIYSGSRGQSNLLYLVRDDYFEPRLGHRAEQGLRSLERKTAAGRATLLETHRFNFVGESVDTDLAFLELERLITLALERFPDISFLSTLELSDGILGADDRMIERRLLPRICCWLARTSEIPSMRRVAWVTGLIVPAWLLIVATR